MLSAEQREALWKQRFRELELYQQEHGDCRVPDRWPTNEKLSFWVAAQRKVFKQGKLSAERQERLESLGFDFCLRVSPVSTRTWEENFQDLKAFHASFGHFSPSIKDPQCRVLGLWVVRQRHQKNSGYQGGLSSEKVQLLESIGFSWKANYKDVQWLQSCQQLQAFQQKYGHCNVDWIEDPSQKYKKLRSWVLHQRESNNASNLPQDRIDRLNSIGFVWKPNKNDQKWDDMFNRLKAFQAKNGHCLVPKDVSPELHGWVRWQRALYKSENIETTRKEKLDSLDFEWDPTQSSREHRAKKATKQWNASFEELVKYQKENGHCNVPVNYGSLGFWVSTQRSRYRHANHGDSTRFNRLSQRQIDNLNSIGFSWEGDMYDIHWDAMCRRLKEYKVSNGDCLVPSRYKQDPELGQWVRVQRKLNNEGNILHPRKQALNAIGFNWAPGEEILTKRAQDIWDERFQELQEFQQTHGHCRVPCQRKAKGTNLQGLSSWVYIQRLRRYPTPSKTRDRRPMPQHEIDRLDSIGFIWRAQNYEERWNDKFKRLLEFKSLHGHCRVPDGYELDTELGVWVIRQKRQYVINKLASNRMEKLEGIGFEWRIRKERGPSRNTKAIDDKWHAQYEQLLEFFDEKGHCFVPGLSSLGSWVSLQRRKIRENTLRNDRKKLLEDLGFVSKVDYTDADASLLQRHWDGLFERLRAFEKEYGHCRVPGGPSFPDQHLSSWVNSQRTQKRKGVLPVSRQTKLEKLGFLWEPGHRGSWVLDKDEPDDEESSLALSEDKEGEATDNSLQEPMDSGSEGSEFIPPRESSMHVSLPKRTKPAPSSEGFCTTQRSIAPGAQRKCSVSDDNTLGEVRKGSRLALYDSDEDVFYNATVSRNKKKRRSCVFVECDDGDQGWVDLETNRFRLLSNEWNEQQHGGMPSRPTKKRKCKPVSHH